MWPVALVLLAAAGGPEASPFLTGFVLDAEGSPVAGAEVLVLRPEAEWPLAEPAEEDPEEGEDDLLPGESTRSGADPFLHGATTDEGAYCIEVPGGAASFHLAVRAPDLATGHWCEVRPAGPPLTLRLELAARLEGTVVAGEDGQPIAQAAATLGRTLPRRGRGQPLPMAIERLLAPGAASDGGGNWVIDGLAPGLYTLRVAVSGRRPWTEKWVSLSAGEARRVDAALPVGTSVTGTVTDADGRPIRGARVALWSDLEDRDRREPLALGGARAWEKRKTDDQGAFSFAGLEVSRRRRLAASHPDHAMAVSDVPDSAERIDLVLTPGARLGGMVVDGDDRPVAGIRIGVVRATEKANGDEEDAPGDFDPFGEVSGGEDPTVTSASGEFLLAHLPAGDFEVHVWPGGDDEAGATRVHLVEGEALTGLRLVVAAALGPSGRVVDERRQPIAEALVMGTWEPWGNDVARTDALGRFRLGRARGAHCRLSASAEGFAATTLDNISANATDVEIVLGRDGAISGCVTLEGGEPASTVKLGAQRAAGERGSLWDRWTPESRSERLVATEDGCYHLEGLAPGTWSVTAGARGYLDVTLEPVRVEAGRVVRAADVTLRRGAVLVGWVVSSLGRLPIAGAEIVLVEGERYDLKRARHLGTGASARSDASGEFRLEGLPPAPVTLLVQHPDFAPREVAGVRPPAAGEGAAPLEITLGPGGAIEGLVTGPDGAPEVGARLHVENARLDQRGSQTTGADGHYRFERLAPGTYTLEKEPRDSRQGASRSATVTVAEGETTRQDFGGEERRMIGRVVRGGKPVGGVLLIVIQVEGDLSAGIEGKSGPDGVYEIRGVLPGRGSIAVSQGDRTYFLPVEIPDVAVFEHDVVLDGISIEGWVIDEDGAALANVPVRGSRGSRARPWQEATGGGMALSDELGRFNIPVAASGSYVLTARRAYEGSSTPQVVEVPEAGLRDVVLRFSPPRRMAGRVVDGDGQPIRGAELLVGEVNVQTDSSGRFVVEVAGDGPVEVSVIAAGYAPLLDRSIGAGAEEAVLVIARGGTLEVDLLAGPEIRRAAKVKLLDGRNYDLLVPLRAIGAWRGLVEEDIAGAGRLVVHDAPAGSYDLVAEAGGKTARAPVTVAPGATTRVTLDLASGAGETPSR